jgi:hypothetical protein
MIKPVIVSSFVIAFGIGSMFAPAGSVAKSADAHAPSHHHNKFVSFSFFGVPYYYDNAYAPGLSENVAAPVLPPKEQPAVEVRRECEPKTYSVPSESGGDSKVTIIRC